MGKKSTFLILYFCMFSTSLTWHERMSPCIRTWCWFNDISIVGQEVLFPEFIILFTPSSQRSDLFWPSKLRPLWWIIWSSSISQYERHTVICLSVHGHLPDPSVYPLWRICPSLPGVKFFVSCKQHLLIWEALKRLMGLWPTIGNI